MEKIVIGIHGIGNKPPAKVLKNWWQKSIIEGLKKQNYSIQDFNFELIYWADILHKTPLDPDEVDKSKPGFMNEKYIPEKFAKISQPTGFRQKAIDYLEKYYDKLMVNGVLSLDNKKITELFIHLHMKDLESYYSDAYQENNREKKLIKEIIQERFINEIMKYKNKKIFLIAHSMGSIIVHDALLEKKPKIKIDTLVTIGSPLAQNYVIHNYEKLKGEESINKFCTPKQIENHWYNLADLEDQVAVHHSLSKFYAKNSRKSILSDKVVQNKFIYEGISNPHKSFGYLRTPEFAEIINTFLETKDAGVIGRMINKFMNLFH